MRYVSTPISKAGNLSDSFNLEIEVPEFIFKYFLGDFAFFFFSSPFFPEVILSGC